MRFKNHKVLKNLEVDLTNENGEPLDIIVFIGDNGVGKTQLLKSIVDAIDMHTSEFGFQMSFVRNELYFSDSSTVLIMDEIEEEETDQEEVRFMKLDEGEMVVWMPAELNIEKTTHFVPEGRIFVEWANQWALADVSDYIIKAINEALYENQDKISSEMIADKCNEFNHIFEILNLDVKLRGVVKELPIFENSAGETFDIHELSSGEKQLFFRLLSLKRLNVNNAIIIIDEPETSLHPEWQRKVIEVYKKIGENNQLILATHSPFVIGSVPSESIRIMKRNKVGRIEVLHQNENDKSYGKSVEDILKITMDLDSLRDEATTEKLSRLGELLQCDGYDTEEYKSLMYEMKKQLGTADKDIMRLEMAQSIRMRQYAKSE